MEKWYVGQKVWDEALHPGLVGRVVEYNEDSRYPVTVRFGDSQQFTYTNEGRRYNTVAPTLRPYPHRITIERIEPEFEKGQIVLVRDVNKSNWKARRYARTAKHGHECYQDLIESCCTWVNCIPFEGNEHLLLTTQEP